MSKKTNRQRRRKNVSRIGDHKRVGKKLITPFNTVEAISHLSWRDDHAPEILWAFLLAAVVPRNDYLACFRAIVRWARENLAPAIREERPKDAEGKVILSDPYELDHTSLSQLPDEKFRAFLSIPLKHSLGYGALRPLLLVDSLPGVERWRKELAIEPTTADWDTLAIAVASSLDHQSEQSTDIRWLKLMTKMAMGKVKFPTAMADLVQEIVEFPNRGDLRKVRPMIRSGEMMIRRYPISPWIEPYWQELMQKTGCIDASKAEDYSELGPVFLKRSEIFCARKDITDRFHEVKSSSRTDARQDSAFGFCLFAISLLEEVAAPPNSHLLVGRLGLRCLAELVVTFAYLAQHDNPDLWKAYRNYGAGQAKLAFLKLEQGSGEAPKFVDQDVLLELANEDVWHEFQDIDFGHWEKKNLRDLAKESNTQDVYDDYYAWTSTFMHGHWCSVRDSNFITCLNPLHRLHRIPRPLHRILPSVVPDAIKLTNKCLELLERCYPTMSAIPKLAIDYGEATGDKGKSTKQGVPEEQ